MTTPELTDTMRRATADLYPDSAEALVRRAVVAGERRRLRNRLAVGVPSAAVLGLVATTVVLTTHGSDAPGREASVVPATRPAAAPTTYAPGSRTEVPGGPVIPTDRRIVGDAALRQVARDLVATGTLTGLSVAHVTGSGVGSHLADTSTDGRALSFQVDGAGAWIAVGRWDGYHAVGFDDSDLQVVEGGLDDALAGASDQKVATTAREACGGAYRVSPAIDCTRTAEGWYSVSRPNAGGEVAGAKELWVELYTPDGWVVRVHTLNTAGEKQGPRVGDGTAISEADSLAIARSPLWFTER